MKKIHIITAALLLCSTPAFAADELLDDLKYGAGVGITSAAFGYNDSIYVFYAMAEKDLDIESPVKDVNLSAQVRFGSGTSVGQSFSGINLSYGIDYFITGYLKATKEFKSVTGYALAGLGYSSFTYQSASFNFFTGATTPTDFTITDFGLTYGVGAEYQVNKELKVAAEYSSVGPWGVLGVNAFYEF